MATASSRRGFMTGSMAAALTLHGTAGQAAAAPAGEPLRIGCINVWSYSHLPTLWAPLIQPRAGTDGQGKPYGDVPFTPMRITHCWDIEPDKAREFAKLYGCEVVRDFDGMVGKVDGIINGGYYNHPWNHILHEPYLEAGLPNLINRPFANSLEKTRRMLDLAERHGATILCPSSHEHNEAITRAKSWTAGKNVICYNATNSFDDYPTHGIHGVYMVCKAVAEAGFPVKSVAYRARSWYSPPGILTLEHEKPDGSTYYGTLHQVSGSWGTVHVHTPEAYGGESFDIRTGTVWPFNKTEIWAPTVWAFQRMAMFGEMPQTADQIYHKVNVWLAGWKSVLEADGDPVALSSVDPGWESPVRLPNHPDDDTVDRFEKLLGK